MTQPAAAVAKPGACLAHNIVHDCYHQHAQACPKRTPSDIWEGDGPQVCICNRPGRTSASASQPSPSPCRDRDAGLHCPLCNHEHCGWCPECHPEVPEW